MSTTHPADKGVKAYARRHAVAASSVRQAVREGRIPVDAGGRIPPEAEAVGATSGPKVSPTLTAARGRKLQAAIRLLDHELETMQANTVTAANLRAGWLTACRAIAAEVERTFGAKVPRTAAAAFAVLRDQVDALLARLLDCLPEELVPAEAKLERPDLTELTVVELATRRADAQSAIMELQHAVMQGDLIRLDRVVAGLEDRIGRCRALLLGIPSRASPMFAMSEAQGRRVVADDLRHALVELAGHGVKVDDYVPATLVEAARPTRAKKSAPPSFKPA